MVLLPIQEFLLHRSGDKNNHRADNVKDERNSLPLLLQEKDLLPFALWKLHFPHRQNLDDGQLLES